MKKIFAFVTVLIFLNSLIQAQDYRKADVAFKSYQITQDKSKLKEAFEKIQGESTDKEALGAAFYQLKGDIYNEVANQITVTKQTGLGSVDDLPNVSDPALIAYNAFVMAFQKANGGNPPKKYEVSDALKGIQSVQGNLYNFGIYAFEERKYESAYANFNNVIKAHELLKNNGQTSTLDDASAYQDQKYITGLAALNANKTSEAFFLFEQLYNSGYDKAAVYEALYMIKSKGSEQAMISAYKYLEEGRKRYPDDVSLLFAEINHFLKLNKLDELISNLKAAIAKEPGNIGLYSTLGNVYDNLYQRETGAGNKTKANEYFDQAFNYYNQALGRDPKYFDAIYSIGALYYNKAAGITTELNELSNDFSKEGLKKYEAKKAEIFAAFDKALPWFQKAERLDPNDLNTLIALKEIYARKDDLATSNILKERLEKVQNGGKNDSSYFK